VADDLYLIAHHEITGRPYLLRELIAAVQVTADSIVLSARR